MSYVYRNPRVQVDLPQPDPDSRLILNHETGRYIRLGLREFDWLNRFDGQIHLRDVPAAIAQDEAFAAEMLRRMSAAKLICFSDDPVQLQPVQHAEEGSVQVRRLEWAQFGQLRIHLGQPRALLDRLSPVTRPLMSKPFIAAGLLFSLTGLGVALAQSAEFGRAMGAFQWSAWHTAAIIALVFATTFVHELGHAVACAYYGAPVRSIGVMVFYLQPAAYADITDSWQLTNRWHRVAISSAGVYVQGLIATGAVLLWTFLRLTGHNADMLVVFVAMNALIIVLNVLPFTKLDGYWIVSNMIGIANLRDRAIEWWRVSITSMLRRRPVDASRLRFNAVLLMTPLGRALLAAFGLTSTMFGFAMWLGGLGFLFRMTRWLGVRQTTSFFAVGGVLLALVVTYFARPLLAARRKARQPQPAPAEQRPAPVAAIVTHVIDPLRPIRLNPHIAATTTGDGMITFGWSTPDAMTVAAPEALFEAIPRLRDGRATLQELRQTDFWSAQVEGVIQRLWHDKHLRYSEDWSVSDENLRYSRQLGWMSMNPHVRGKETEALARIRKASVTILGVGGLGTHVAWNLAASGIGELHLLDGDVIELTNLNRQLFYTPDDIGLRKVDVAAQRLMQFNPQLRVRKTHKYLQSLDDVMDAVKGSTFVIRAVDSPQESLAWVNEACVRLGIPYSGAGFFAQGTIVGPTVIPGQSSCLACNTPVSTPRFDRGTGGTLAPLVFTTAGLLASEAITFLGNLGSIQTMGRMLAINAPALSFNFRDVARNDDCAVCGQEEKRRVSA